MQFVRQDCYCFYYHIIRDLIIEGKYAGAVTTGWARSQNREKQEEPAGIISKLGLLEMHEAGDEGERREADIW